uniref:Chromosome partition protein Smc n=1 Tax=Pseudomonas phage Orisa03 TaxID=3138542 RepID=A0AAU6W3I8_9VIRU
MSDLQKRLQAGASNMAQANNLLAEAYAAIGGLESDNAGLKTGYEAYERVNAELRAECEALRKYGEEFASLAERRREQIEALRNTQSFSDAFYEVSGLLGVTGARPEAPLVVFRQEVVPALQAVIRNSRRYEWLKPNATIMLKKTIGYNTSIGFVNTIYPSAMEMDAALDVAMNPEDSQ